MNKGKKELLALAAMGAMLVLGTLAAIFGDRLVPPARQTFAPGGESAAVLVIDAGHGGADGGAVSRAGVPECDINLAIARRLEALAGFCGVDTLMTRTDENSVHSPEAVTIRQQKVSDLKNRAALINETPGAFLVSIHQNSFTDPKYSGAQVFYKNTPAGAAAAEAVQENLRLALEPENSRAAAPVPESVYLFQNIGCGAVLVECGFMSNPQEAQRLAGEDYQKKIACAVLCALLEGGGPGGSEVLK